jgi:hypothetical protein
MFSGCSHAPSSSPERIGYSTMNFTHTSRLA